MGPAACEACDGPLGDLYFDHDGLRCGRCHAEARREANSATRLLAAALYGCVAAVAAIAGWAAIAYVTEREFYVLTAFIGVGVGVAVRAGGSDRGGKFYQCLAASLTYVAIAAAPVVFSLLMGQASQLAGLDVVTLALTLPLEQLRIDPVHAAPRLVSLVGGVWFAWSINAPRDGLFGPYALTPAVVAGPGITPAAGATAGSRRACSPARAAGPCVTRRPRASTPNAPRGSKPRATVRRRSRRGRTCCGCCRRRAAPNSTRGGNWRASRAAPTCSRRRSLTASAPAGPANDSPALERTNGARHSDDSRHLTPLS
ncbi:hypothetical protein [Nannocystis pusilla]|uniref:hypothetical protein n=1 Tax=Nannocystis pusilla TaxID=889268 RepID=UPI003B7E501A